MKKKFRVVKNFKIVKRSCSLNRYYRVCEFCKQIFLFSFEPKNERNVFLICALASKNGSNQKNEGTLLLIN